MGAKVPELLVASSCLLVNKVGLEVQDGRKILLCIYFDSLYRLSTSLRKEGRLNLGI